MKTQTPPFGLRLPQGWRDAVKAEASKQHRSMNAEIISAIEVAFSIKGVALPETPAEK